MPAALPRGAPAPPCRPPSPSGYRLCWRRLATGRRPPAAGRSPPRHPTPL